MSSYRYFLLQKVIHYACIVKNDGKVHNFWNIKYIRIYNSHIVLEYLNNIGL